MNGPYNVPWTGLDRYDYDAMINNNNYQSNQIPEDSDKTKVKDVNTDNTDQD